MEFVNDYDMVILYHESMVNIVADVLSRKSLHSVSTIALIMMLGSELEAMGFHMIRKGDKVSDLTLEPELYEQIREKQLMDSRIVKWRESVEKGESIKFSIQEDRSLRFGGRWCIPDDEDLKRLILTEAHCTPYSVHPGGDKLYMDLKKTFWWPGMKIEVATFVSRCLTCQKVKIEHGRPQGKIQSLDVTEWKWESTSLDFIVGLPKSKKGNNMLWVIVDRLRKSAHFIPMKDTWRKVEQHLL